MNKGLVARLWTGIGLALLYLTLNAWLRSQGANLAFPGFDFEEYGPGSTALFGIVFGAPLLLVMGWIGRHHLDRCCAPDWPHRVPRFWDWEYEPGSLLGRRLQGAALVGFLIIPAIAQIHFLVKLASTSVVERASGRVVANGLEAFFHPFPPKSLNDAYRLYETNGVTYLPVIEPWLLLLLVLVTLTQTARLLRGILRVSQPESEKTAGEHP